jgi:hypothetical protein
VDAFLIGSELKYLGFVRDGAADFPAVEALKTLADDVKGMRAPLLGCSASTAGPTPNGNRLNNRSRATACRRR